MGDQGDNRSLHRALAEHFSQDELKLLCFNTGIDPETVPYAERGKEVFTYCLVETFRRKSLLPSLLQKCEMARPEVDWPALAVDTTVPADWASWFAPERLINTQGGAAVIGNVDTSGGDFVGRDKYTITEETAYTVAGLPNPYLGLRAFTYDDHLAYAGRKLAVDEAAARLTAPGKKQAILFVTGASGCGKSSFAQAGLLPALEAHYARRDQRIRIAVFKPGEHPVAMLEDARKQLAARQGEIDIFIVDQFEELFTQSQPDERKALFDWLTSLPAFEQSNTHVIATLRSDYLKELFDAEPAWNLAKSNGIELRKMSVDELKDAIQQPLQANAAQDPAFKGKRFEPALLDKLAQDASASPTLLPLLQVTLAELWKKGKLTLANYGTLTDAIRARADQVLAFKDYDAANPSQPRSQAEQAAVLATFLDLVSVTLDEDPRPARVSLDVAALSRDRQALVDDLTNARLLSMTTAVEVKTVTIIHESLIANWGRLKQAIDEEHEKLRRRKWFMISLRDWYAVAQIDTVDRSSTSANPDNYLLTGVRLQQAQILEQQDDVILHNELARTFFQASLAREEALKNHERIRDIASAHARSRKLAAEAIRCQHPRDRDLGLLLSVEAMLAANTYEAQSALLGTLQAGALLMEFPRSHDHDITVECVIFHPGGKLLVSSSNYGDIILWDVSEPTLPIQMAIQRLKLDRNEVRSLAFSPDGQMLAAGTGDGSVILLDVSQPASPRLIKSSLGKHSDFVRSIAFSPNGQLLASGSGDDTLTLWDISRIMTQEHLGTTLSSMVSGVSCLAFGKDSAILVVGGNSESIVLWDVSQPTSPMRINAVLGHHHHVPSGVFSLKFDPDGQILASGGNDGSIILWDMSQPRAPEQIGLPIRAHDNSVSSFAFSPDGRTLISSSWDGTIVVWDLTQIQSPKMVGTPLKIGDKLNANGIYCVTFSPNGRVVAVAGRNPPVAIVNLDPTHWVQCACRIVGRNLTQSEWLRFMGDAPYRKTCDAWPEGE